MSWTERLAAVRMEWICAPGCPAGLKDDAPHLNACKRREQPLEPAWAFITIELLPETDYKTAGRIFGTLENYTVRLKLKDQPYKDARIVDASALEERAEGVDYACGFDYVLLNDDGNAISDELFVAYEDIEAIGVY